MATTQRVTESDRPLLGTLGGGIETVQPLALGQQQENDAFRESNLLLQLALDSGTIGIYECNLDAGELRWDDRVRAHWGLSPGGPIDYDLFMNAIHPDDRAAMEAALARAMDAAGNGRYQAQYRVIGIEDGVQRWIAASGQVLFQSGRAVRLVGTTREVTEAKNSEREMATLRDELADELAAMLRLHHVSTRFLQANNLEALFEQLLEATLAETKTDKGTIQLFLPGTRQLRIVAQRGLTPQFVDFFGVIAEGEAACGLAMQQKRRIVVEDVLTSTVFAGSPARGVLLAEGIRALQSTPLLSRSGEFLGIISTYFGEPHTPSDRTLRLIDLLARQAADWIEYQRSEAAFRRVNESLALAQRAAGGGVWDLDVRSGDLYVSPEYRRLYGLSEDYRPTFDGWLSLIDEKDRRRMAEARGSLFESGADWNVEFRISHPQRGARWLAGIGRLERDGDGKPLRFSGINFDITERKEAEEKLRYQLHLVRSISASAVESILVVDDKGKVIFVNPEAEDTFGFMFEELYGEVLHDKIHYRHADGRPLSLAQCPLHSVHQSGEPVRNHEDMFFRKDGTAVHVSCSNGPLDLGDGLMGTVLVAHDITERKRLEAELRQNVERLREADRKKDEFIATLAHELRNPLAPVRNAIEMLKLCPLDEPDFVWSRSLVDEQIKHLVRLVDDLLDVSRITRNRLELKKERISLTEAIHAALDATQTLIAEHGQHLAVALPAETIYLDADAVRLSQVFTNLINNAAKYTPPGGRLRLEADREGASAVVRVVDDGKGIAAEDVARVFEMFFQADRSDHGVQSGLGIGLTLVKSLVELHGGTVEARSAGVGRGSEFIVRLPAPLQLPESLDPADATRPPAHCRRILIADDYPNAAESLARWLRRCGNNVRTALDGAQALEQAEQFRPEIVLLDLGMPKLNGYEVTRRLRQQPWGDEILIVALTGWGQEEDRRRTREAGFDAHLIKPIKHDEISALLERRRHPVTA
jgi:PAS domain S-box-containing protein